MTTKHPETAAQTVAASPGDILSRLRAGLDRAREILNWVAELRTQHEGAENRRQACEAATIRLSMQLNTLLDTRSQDRDSGFQARRAELEQALRQSRMELERETAILNDAAAEIRRLETVELPACKVDVSVEDVLAHQAAVDQAFSDISALKTAMDGQRQIISAAKATISPIQDRRAERENLMAEIALGNASDSDLGKLDSKIGAEKKAYDEAVATAGPSIEKAQAVLNGMERKLFEAQAKADAMVSDGQEVLRHFLRCEAERVAEEYIALARKIKESYFRLRSLDRIICAHGGRSLMAAGSDRLHLCVFNLPQFKGLSHSNPEPGTLFSAEWERYGDAYTKAALGEKSRLATLGIRF